MIHIALIVLIFILSVFACDLGQIGGLPNPTPAPSAAPSPEPSATPEIGCNLPSLPDHGDCPREKIAHLLPAVESAIDDVMKNRPELFDFDDQPVDGQPRVLNLGAYYIAVQDALKKQGLCAKADDRFEEIGVKNTNDYNEQFDVARGDLYVRRGFGAYRSTCYPSAF